MICFPCSYLIPTDIPQCLALPSDFISSNTFSTSVNSFSVFGDDRMETNPEFDYDILAWMNSKEVSFLNSFELDKKLKIIFELTEDQYKTVEDSLDIFGHNKIGRSQVIKVVGQNKLWRKPVIIK